MQTLPTGNDNLATWLAYLEPLKSNLFDLSTEAVRTVYERMALKPTGLVFLVSGTNGKGSTCHLLEAIYRAAGYQTGLFTSPHLVRYNERIRINGECASDEAIVDAFARIQEAAGDVHLSYFEYAFLAALYLFKGADVVVLEVGLGGRLDATNIVDPDCSIITSVALDHCHILGDTREKIGWEKAHIFRKGKPAIYADPVPVQTVLDFAEEIGADLWRLGVDYNYSGDQQQWAYAGRSYRRAALPWPALRGANQILNAASVMAAIESVQHILPVDAAAMKEGLIRVRLTGRFQILPGQPTIIFDVAHNPHSCAALSHNLDHMSYFPYTYAVVGMLKDKDARESLQHFKGKVDHWFCCTLPGDRGQKGQVLADLLREMMGQDKEGFPRITVYDSPGQAYDAAQAAIQKEDRLIVFGSFVTVSEVLTHIGREVE